jgi:hypothetical protein
MEAGQFSAAVAAAKEIPILLGIRIERSNATDQKRLVTMRGRTRAGR